MARGVPGFQRARKNRPSGPGMAGPGRGFPWRVCKPSSIFQVWYGPFPVFPVPAPNKSLKPAKAVDGPGIVNGLTKRWAEHSAWGIATFQEILTWPVWFLSERPGRANPECPSPPIEKFFSGTKVRPQRGGKAIPIHTCRAAKPFLEGPKGPGNWAQRCWNTAPPRKGRTGGKGPLPQKGQAGRRGPIGQFLQFFTGNQPSGAARVRPKLDGSKARKRAMLKVQIRVHRFRRSDNPSNMVNFRKKTGRPRGPGLEGGARGSFWFEVACVCYGPRINNQGEWAPAVNKANFRTTFSHGAFLAGKRPEGSDVPSGLPRAGGRCPWGRARAGGKARPAVPPPSRPPARWTNANLFARKRGKAHYVNRWPIVDYPILSGIGIKRRMAPQKGRVPFLRRGGPNFCCGRRGGYSALPLGSGPSGHKSHPLAGNPRGRPVLPRLNGPNELFSRRRRPAGILRSLCQLDFLGGPKGFSAGPGPSKMGKRPSALNF